MISSGNTGELDLASPNVNISSQNIEENDKVDKKSFISRLRDDKEYREKFLYTTLILCLHFVLGWKIALIGPSLLDLQHITNTTLDKISGIFSAEGIGYLLGSLVSGIMFQKFSSAIMFTISSVVSAVIIIAIPFCSIFGVMIVMFASKGIFDAFVESISHAELFRIWETDNNIFVPTLHFCYTLGASLSPLVVAPFLLTPANDEMTSMKNITCNQSLNVDDITNYNRSSEDCLSIYGIKPSNDEPILYIPYTITGLIYVIIGALFFYSLLKLDGKFFQHKQNDVEDKKTMDKPSIKINIVICTIIASMSFSYFVFESSLTDFLPMFCVKQLKWTKTSASYLSALHWGTFALGRFLSIFCLTYFKPSILIGVTSSMLIVSFNGILLSSLYMFNPGLWVSVSISGLVISPMLPSIFTWINSALLEVTGFVSSLIFTFISLGAIINPIILGHLMDNVDKMAFCYIIVSASTFFLIIFTVGWIFSKKLKNSKSQNYSILRNGDNLKQSYQSMSK